MGGVVGVGVGVMVLNESGQVLLGKRHEDPNKATSLLKGAGTWTMPGGKIDFGESFEECAKRETQEETGLELKNVEVICVNNDVVEDAHFVTIGLLASFSNGDFEGEPVVAEPDKITEWHWFDLDDLPSPMYFPSEKILKNYGERKFFILND